MGSAFLSERLFINGSNVSYNTLSGAPLFKFAILIYSFQEKEPSIALTYAFFNLEFMCLSQTLIYYSLAFIVACTQSFSTCTLE